MNRSISRVTLVVRDYDEAIEFFCGKLGFELIEDTALPDQGKRWVVVGPAGSAGTTLLLARAATPEQEARIGDQTGTVAVFEDLYGNRWDLIGPGDEHE